MLCKRRSVTPTHIALRPVSSVAFSPFGTLAEMGQPAVPANNGTALRHDIDRFPSSAADPSSSLVTSIFEADGLLLPRSIGMLERHSCSSQLIMPIASSGHIVVVCLNGVDDAPDLRTLVAFRFDKRQGMIYRSGVWHHPILALGRKALFLVQSWKNETERDCEIATIAQLVIGSDLISSSVELP